jgi:hypothetical protein
MSGGVADFGFAEVGADPVGEFLEAVEEGTDRLFQFVACSWCCAGGHGPFEVGVKDLVGVEFGAVSGQEVHLDRRNVIVHPLPDGLAAVDRMTVDDQVDLTIQVTGQPVQERHEHAGVGGSRAGAVALIGGRARSRCGRMVSRWAVLLRGLCLIACSVSSSRPSIPCMRFW